MGDSEATGLANDFDYYLWQVLHWNEECIDDVFEWFHAANGLVSNDTDSQRLTDAYIEMPGIPRVLEEYERLCDVHGCVVAVDKCGGVWRIVGNHHHELWHPGDMV